MSILESSVHPEPCNYKLLLNSSSNALANGKDCNTANAILTAQGRPLAGCSITFTLSCHAWFCDGSQQFCTITDDCGEARAYFTDTWAETITVTAQTESIYASSQSTFLAMPQVQDYQLLSQVRANYAPADGTSLNGVRYTLYSPSFQSVYNKRLEFIVMAGNAEPIVPTNYTNYNGIIDVGLRSSIPGDVDVTAYLTDDASVRATERLTFVSPGPILPPDYALTAAPVVNNAVADPNFSNTVRFTLTYLGSSVQGNLRIYEIDGLGYSVVTTGADGIYLAAYSSSEPGSFTVRAELESDIRFVATQVINFLPVSYPLFLGSVLIPSTRGQFLGIDRLLADFYITAGHVYQIEGFMAGFAAQSCGVGHVFDDFNQICDTDLTISYQHNGYSFTLSRALASGQGNTLFSNAYYYYAAPRSSFTIQVHDNGPGS